jgi:hypothetical protein
MPWPSHAGATPSVSMYPTRSLPKPSHVARVDSVPHAHPTSWQGSPPRPASALGTLPRARTHIHTHTHADLGTGVGAPDNAGGPHEICVEGRLVPERKHTLLPSLAVREKDRSKAGAGGGGRRCAATCSACRAGSASGATGSPPSSVIAIAAMMATRPTTGALGGRGHVAGAQLLRRCLNDRTLWIISIVSIRSLFPNNDTRSSQEEDREPAALSAKLGRRRPTARAAGRPGVPIDDRATRHAARINASAAMRTRRRVGRGGPQSDWRLTKHKAKERGRGGRLGHIVRHGRDVVSRVWRCSG